MDKTTVESLNSIKLTQARIALNLIVQFQGVLPNHINECIKETLNLLDKKDDG